MNKPEPNTALASNSCPASLLNAGQQVATASCAPPFLSVADLGSPGPLVHTLERMRGHYERELVESIKRRPTPRAIWMVNRILNGTRVPEQRQFYMDLLRFAAEHPSAPEVARYEAQHFIQYQSGVA